MVSSDKFKKLCAAGLVMVMILGLCACGVSSKEEKDQGELVEGGTKEIAEEQETLTIAAAASLEKVLTEELIPRFCKEHSNIKIQGTYDSSGKLQTQIEEGAEVDIFFSAAMKQMNGLKEKDLIEEDTVVELLENKIVMIVPVEKENEFSRFEEIVKADMIAIGDPESVPAGQYAKEVLTNLGLWEKVQDKLSLGTNVTEVLSWVAASSADAGIVYATDVVAVKDKVVVVQEAKEGTCSKVIYPVGVLKSSKHFEAAKAFLEFLQSEEAMKVFEAAGFSSNLK